MRRRYRGFAVYLGTFGVGLLVCYVLPTRLVLLLLAIALILCAFFCGRR